MSKHHISATINGTVYEDDVDSRMLLVHWIRDGLQLTGTHIGCDTTACGACTILVDGKATKSFTMFAVQANGRQIMTVEGLEQNGKLHPLQEGFHEIGISGNLCRCTGYINIVKAIQYAAEKMQVSEELSVPAQVALAREASNGD